MIIMNEIDFEECLKDSPAYRYVHQSEERPFLSLSLSLVLSMTLSFLPRNQLRQATVHIDMLEDRLEQVCFPIDQEHTHIDFIRLQMSKSCNSVINSGKIFVQEFQYDESLFSIYLSLIVLFRKFLKCIYDVGELFTSDDITYKNLVKFSDYLREIQGLFSVNINRLT